jgi:hypothetical protein
VLVPYVIILSVRIDIIPSFEVVANDFLLVLRARIRTGTQLLRIK